VESNLRIQVKALKANINQKDHMIVCIVNHINIHPKQDPKDSFKKTKHQIQDKGPILNSPMEILAGNSRKGLAPEGHKIKALLIQEVGEQIIPKEKQQKVVQIQVKVNQKIEAIPTKTNLKCQMI